MLAIKTLSWHLSLLQLSFIAMLFSGCTDVTPEVSVIQSSSPSRAKIEDNYLAFYGSGIAYGQDITISDPSGNSFDLTLSHIKNGFRYFEANRPGLIIKTGVVYSVLVRSAKASSPTPVIFESEGALPSGGSNGQILTIVSGVARWTSLNLGAIASKNSIESADIESIEFSKISNLPASFVPSIHSHAISDVSSLQGVLDKKISKISSGASFSIMDDSVTIGAGALDIQSSRSNSSAAATGVESVAVGLNNTASGTKSYTLGSNNKVATTGSVAIGSSNTVESLLGRVFGHLSTLKSSAIYAVILGSNDEVGGAYSVTVGNHLVNDFDGAVMYGYSGNYKLFVSGPLVFKASSPSHQNKKFYCDTFIYMTNGSFSKGFVIIQTDFESKPSILSSNARVSFYDSSTVPVVSITTPDSTSVDVSSSLPKSKVSFECQNLD